MSFNENTAYNGGGGGEKEYYMSFNAAKNDGRRNENVKMNLNAVHYRGLIFFLKTIPGSFNYKVPSSQYLLTNFPLS